jgi:catechol 2,3-dioxygenase-like lactoylglutathione lyase family enzyme
MTTPAEQLPLDELVCVRYLVDDVQAAVDFYTGLLGFTLRHNYAPTYADLTRGYLRLQVSGLASSAGQAMPDGRVPAPGGGWNRVELQVDNLDAEVQRLGDNGVTFRNTIVPRHGGGLQVLLDDPVGNPIGLFQTTA